MKIFEVYSQPHLIRPKNTQIFCDEFWGVIY